MTSRLLRHTSWILKLISTALSLLLSIPAPAQKQSRLDQPLVKIWTYLTAELSRQALAADSEQVYVPLTAGRIIALGLRNGSELWRVDLQSRISTNLLTREHELLVATSSAAGSGALYALNKQTGAVIWKREFQGELTSLGADGHDSRILVGSTEGTLYCIDEVSSRTIWTVQTGGPIRGKGLIADNLLYVGSDDGALYSLHLKSGRRIWRFQTHGPVRNRPTLDDQNIYFGSSDGYVYAVKKKKGNLRWKTRTGAAIEASLLLVKNHLIAASFDDFIYDLNPRDGSIRWKARLSGRITFDPIASSDFILTSPLRSHQAIVLRLSDGKQINAFALEPEREIISQPIFAGDFLILTTDEGIIILSPAASLSRGQCLQE